MNYSDLPSLTDAELAAVGAAWALSKQCAALEAKQARLKEAIAARSSCVSLGCAGPKTDGSRMAFDCKTVQRYPI